MMSEEFKRGLLQAAEMARVMAAGLEAQPALPIDLDRAEAAALRSFARELEAWVDTEGYDL